MPEPIFAPGDVIVKLPYPKDSFPWNWRSESQPHGPVTVSEQGDIALVLDCKHIRSATLNGGWITVVALLGGAIHDSSACESHWASHWSAAPGPEGRANSAAT